MSTPRSAGPVRLLLVEDHSMVAMALDSAFASVDDIELIGQATSVRQAVDEVAVHAPDVVLLDRRLPDGDGVAAIPRLRERAPSTRVLLFTGAADHDLVRRVADAGGAGVLLKAGLLPDLLDTIRRVAAGQDSFDIESPR